MQPSYVELQRRDARGIPIGGLGLELGLKIRCRRVELGRSTVVLRDLFGDLMTKLQFNLGGSIGDAQSNKGKQLVILSFAFAKNNTRFLRHPDAANPFGILAKKLRIHGEGGHPN